ncbi:HNH endonuclease signature motif containing protein [Azohydromonas aeria]|uniref:HNH endonuclease signature motif containing protein n=1 Tax=Azohydromonas aeria TaxID=2590212 RepID=UPI0012FCEE8D|nr:HNH endonuclease signature motif containing protein [Azohydromonas aeria]
MTRRYWTESEVAWLRKRYSEVPARIIAATLDRDVQAIYRKAMQMGLKAPAERVAKAASERMRSCVNHGGRATQFKQGIVPWNTGRRGETFEGSQYTQFKPGHRPQTWVPVGTYTVNPDGLLEQKVGDDPGPRTARWKPVHRLVWEAANGPMPAGHVVVFKPGRHSTDPERITLDAVECITRRELMLRNTIHRYGPEVADAMRLRAALGRELRERAKEAEGHE